MSTYSPEVVEKALELIGIKGCTPQEYYESSKVAKTTFKELLKEIANLKQGFGVPHEKMIERLDAANNGDYTGTLLKHYYSTEALRAELSSRQASIFPGGKLELQNFSNNELIQELNVRGCRGVIIANSKLSPKEKEKFIEEYNAVKNQFGLPELASTAVDYWKDFTPITGAQLSYICEVMPELITAEEAEKEEHWLKYQDSDSKGWWESAARKVTQTIIKPPVATPAAQEPMTLSQYQENALLTESPMEPADLARWKAALPAALVGLSRSGTAINKLKLDKLKKFAAYGTFPEDLVMANHEEITLRKRMPQEIVATIPVYRAIHALLGIMTEAEEMTEWLDNAIGEYDWIPELRLEYFDVGNLKEEIGDFFWYFSLLADVFSFTLQECLELNEKKLQVLRYKKGIFSPEEAAKRNLDAEKALFSPEKKAEALQAWSEAKNEPASKQEVREIMDRVFPRQKPTTVDGSKMSAAEAILHYDDVVAMRDTLAATKLREDTPCAMPAAVRSDKNKNVWQRLMDYVDQDVVVIPKDYWYFTDEAGQIFPQAYISEALALKGLEGYCANILGEGAPVDTSHDKCGFCGKTGHNIITCPDKARQEDTPIKLDQEQVEVPAAPPKPAIVAGSTVRSMRKTLTGYRFIFLRQVLEGVDGDSEPIAYCSVDNIPPDNDAKLTLGEEVRLSPDELVLYKPTSVDPSPEC